MPSPLAPTPPTRTLPTRTLRTSGTDVDGFLLFLLANLFVYGDVARDPANAAWTSPEQVRQLDCERLSQADAHARHPGTVPPPNARSTTLMQIDALECRQRVV